MAENCEAFPQEKAPDKASGAAFFAAQTYTVAAEETATGRVPGYIHSSPNNICPCGCIANVSCAVAASCRGLHIGEKLVPDCLTQAKAHGFRVMQLNAAVASSTYARHLYERLGFCPLRVPLEGRALRGHLPVFAICFDFEPFLFERFPDALQTA